MTMSLDLLGGKQALTVDCRLSHDYLRHAFLILHR